MASAKTRKVRAAKQKKPGNRKPAAQKSGRATLSYLALFHCTMLLCFIKADWGSVAISFDTMMERLELVAVEIGRLLGPRYRGSCKNILAAGLCDRYFKRMPGDLYSATDLAKKRYKEIYERHCQHIGEDQIARNKAMCQQLCKELPRTIKMTKAQLLERVNDLNDLVDELKRPTYECTSTEKPPPQSTLSVSHNVGEDGDMESEFDSEGDTLLDPVDVTPVDKLPATPAAPSRQLRGPEVAYLSPVSLRRSPRRKRLASSSPSPWGVQRDIKDFHESMDVDEEQPTDIARSVDDDDILPDILNDTRVPQEDSEYLPSQVLDVDFHVLPNKPSDSQQNQAMFEHRAEKLSGMGAERDELKAQVLALRYMLIQKDALVEDLDERCVVLELERDAQSSGNNQRIAELEASIDGLTQQIENKEADIKGLRQTCEDQLARIKALENLCGEQGEQIQKLEADLEDVTREREKFRHERDVASGGLAQLMQHRDALLSMAQAFQGIVLPPAGS